MERETGGSLGHAEAVREDNRQPLYRERDYLRLAIAQTVDYLQSDNQSSLDGAAQILEKLKDKATMPEIAYWTGFVKALQAMENSDSRQFVSQVYDIWNNAVLYIEQGALTGAAPNPANGKSAPYHYRNLVNLVVNRAIIDRKLADLNALGPLFLMLKERDLEEKEGEGNYLTSLVQRIAEGFVAPDSDRYRLNFTVAMIEAKTAAADRCRKARRRRDVGRGAQVFRAGTAFRRLCPQVGRLPPEQRRGCGSRRLPGHYQFRHSAPGGQRKSPGLCLLCHAPIARRLIHAPEGDGHIQRHRRLHERRVGKGGLREP